MACAIRSLPMVFRAMCAPAWACRTGRSEGRHREQRELRGNPETEYVSWMLRGAGHSVAHSHDQPAGDDETKSGSQNEIFTKEIRHRRLRRDRIHRPARRRVSGRAIQERFVVEMGDGRT